MLFCYLLLRTEPSQLLFVTVVFRGCFLHICRNSYKRLILFSVKKAQGIRRLEGFDLAIFLILEFEEFLHTSHSVSHVS